MCKTKNSPARSIRGYNWLACLCASLFLFPVASRAAAVADHAAQFSVVGAFTQTAEQIFSRVRYDLEHFERTLRLYKRGYRPEWVSAEVFARQVELAQRLQPVAQKIIEQEQEYRVGQALSTPNRQRAGREYWNLVAILNMAQALHNDDQQRVLDIGSSVEPLRLSPELRSRDAGSATFLDMEREYAFLMAAASFHSGDDAAAQRYISSLGKATEPVTDLSSAEKTKSPAEGTSLTELADPHNLHCVAIREAIRLGDLALVPLDDLANAAIEPTPNRASVADNQLAQMLVEGHVIARSRPRLLASGAMVLGAALAAGSLALGGYYGQQAAYHAALSTSAPDMSTWERRRELSNNNNARAATWTRAGGAAITASLGAAAYLIYSEFWGDASN